MNKLHLAGAFSQGFDAERALRLKGGLGLQNILNRARLSGGESAIHSRRGKARPSPARYPKNKRRPEVTQVHIHLSNVLTQKGAPGRSAISFVVKR